MLVISEITIMKIPFHNAGYIIKRFCIRLRIHTANLFHELDNGSYQITGLKSSITHLRIIFMKTIKNILSFGTGRFPNIGVNVILKFPQNAGITRNSIGLQRIRGGMTDSAAAHVCKRVFLSQTNFTELSNEPVPIFYPGVTGKIIGVFHMVKPGMLV